MQFFYHLGQWLRPEQIKKIREKEAYDRQIFCPYCTSKATKHMKDCPTRQPDFNQETAHVLTKEEREELINKQ